MILDKAAILGRVDLKQETVAVPEWYGDVILREMTGAERDDFEASMFVGQGKMRKQNLSNLRARMLARCIIDEDGNRLFSDAEIDALGGKSASALDRLFAVAQRLNGLGNADVEVLAGNSAPGQSDASISDSL